MPVQSNTNDDTENSILANESTTLLNGDSMVKNIQGAHLGKAFGHRVEVNFLKHSPVPPPRP